MEKKALTAEQIDENMKRLNEAIGIAKLDNHAELDDEYLEDLKKLAQGIMTPDELKQKTIRKYKK